LDLGRQIAAFGTSEDLDACMVVTFFNNAMDSKFGFSSFAETWNGRLAMMGFIIGLGTELLTGQGILSQIGMG
jgi:ferrochelatase